MTKCKLCLDKDANQTGSHIFTYSWIKSAINESGKLVADKTLHTLSSFFSKSYRSIFGFKPTREILKAAINEVNYNERISDSDRYTAQNVIKSFAKIMYESIRK